jgi:cobalt-zinc-cadmium efflux system membrane fusion protein
MMRIIKLRECLSLIPLLLLIVACGHKSPPAQNITPKDILVKDNGVHITFPDSSLCKSFKSEKVFVSSVQAELKTPARVIATIVKSVENSQQNLVLFENPDLTANYTAFLQHVININTYKVNLARVKDLAANGASTGKEVIEAETQLANERAAIIEDEAKLKLAGLDPEQLIKAKLHSVWLICDIPETQIDNLITKGSCKITFSSFPQDVFQGKIEETGEVVDPITRMVKLRVSIPNPDNKIKAGMFASVQFGIREGNYVALSKDALVNVQGKNFVFVKTSPVSFERREVLIGDQLNNQIIIFQGLVENENVVITGTMQLKGLSFGY